MVPRFHGEYVLFSSGSERVRVELRCAPEPPCTSPDNKEVKGILGLVYCHCYSYYSLKEPEYITLATR